jgi:hypothetical protein
VLHGTRVRNKECYRDIALAKAQSSPGKKTTFLRALRLCEKKLYVIYSGQ